MSRWVRCNSLGLVMPSGSCINGCGMASGPVGPISCTGLLWLMSALMPSPDSSRGWKTATSWMVRSLIWCVGVATVQGVVRGG